MSGIKVGDKLPNGATALQVRVVAPNRSVVLAIFHDEFVTWEAGLAAGEIQTYWGHYYYDDLPTALVDFNERS